MEIPKATIGVQRMLHDGGRCAQFNRRLLLILATLSLGLLAATGVVVPRPRLRASVRFSIRRIKECPRSSTQKTQCTVDADDDLLH